MCDIYIDGIGYVCSSCEDEFKEYLEAKGIKPETDKEVAGWLALFMTTTAGFWKRGDPMNVHEL